MGLFKQKPPYSCKILERYKIDIEKIKALKGLVDMSGALIKTENE